MKDEDYVDLADAWINKFAAPSSAPKTISNELSERRFRVLREGCVRLCNKFARRHVRTSSIVALYV